MKSIFKLLGMLVVPLLTFGQSVEKSDFFGNKFDRTEICENASSFMSEEEVDALITKLLSAQGLKNRYIVVSCPSVGNCMATLDKNKRPVILFNPTFLGKVKKLQFSESDLPKVSDTDWEALTILAHELGHHLNNHLTNPLPGATPWQQELEADETAGFIMFIMGGELNKILSAYKNVSLQGSYSHPPKEERLNSLRKGYNDARQRNFKNNKEMSKVDLYNLGISNFKSGNYILSDSIFNVYTNRFPEEIFGYYWCARSKHSLDDSTNSKGLAVEAYKLLALKARQLDVVKYKSQAVSAYFFLIQYYNDIAKDYKTALSYCDKILEIDGTNENAKKIRDILTKVTNKKHSSSVPK